MLECPRFNVAVMVPEPVTGVEPMVSVELLSERPTDVTVPMFCVRQLPLIEKQPFKMFSP